jgi:Helix-turn-helix domain
MTIATTSKDAYTEWLDITETRRMLGASRTVVDQLIKSKAFRACQLRVPGKKFGKWIINRASLEEFLSKQGVA